MALQFIDGFDYYTNLYYNWHYNTDGRYIAIASGIGRSLNSYGPVGSLAVGGSTTNLWLQRYITTANTTIIGFAIKFTYLTYATSFQILQLGNSGVGTGFTNKLALGWNIITNGLDVYDPSAPSATRWAMLAPLSSITTNNWYYIEWKNTSGVVDIYVNEKPYWSLISNTKTFYTGSINAIGFGTDISLLNNNYYIDDLYIMDDVRSGIPPVNYGPIGNSKITTILPASNGSLHAWTPFSGTNYNQINSVPDDGGTTYVSATTVGTSDNYNYTQVTSIPACVYGIKINTIGRKSPGIVRQIKPTMLDGAVSSAITTANITLPESYGNQSAIFQARPSDGKTFVGLGPLALATINAAKYGFILTT